VDAYTPAAADARRPPRRTLLSELVRNIQRLKLDVKQIAALHGPRLTTMAESSHAIGVAGRANELVADIAPDTGVRPSPKRTGVAFGKTLTEGS